MRNIQQEIELAWQQHNRAREIEMAWEQHQTTCGIRKGQEKVRLRSHLASLSGGCCVNCGVPMVGTGDADNAPSLRLLGHRKNGRANPVVVCVGCSRPKGRVN